MEAFGGASARHPSATSAREVLEQLGRELAPVEQAIRTHRYLAAAPPDEALRAFAGEQYTVLHSDRRSFAYVAARFPEAPAGDFFLGLAHVRVKRSCGCSHSRSRWELASTPWPPYEPSPGCQAYTAFVSWLALGGAA